MKDKKYFNETEEFRAPSTGSRALDFPACPKGYVKHYTHISFKNKHTLNSRLIVDKTVNDLEHRMDSIESTVINVPFAIPSDSIFVLAERRLSMSFMGTTANDKITVYASGYFEPVTY